MDEALDFISDNMKSPTINLATGTQTPVDFKEAILSALISRVKMANEHGETQQEERPIHEIDQPQEEVKAFNISKAAETYIISDAAMAIFGTNIPTFFAGREVMGGFGANGVNNSWEI